ncbi:hypothetical protein CLCR_11085 [Cladophialophora carrionii]|uniref:Uncharacterized protein n=1 Tax=Cladophialophora carrionii TaxID=86049 RepID=A0A1C1CYF8_9EURO|nr:hypothetical protein CLCR_11085 [Cladophialophora carrionii]
MERIRVAVPEMSRAERLNYYHEHAYNYDHLRFGFASSQYYHRKQAQLLKALDVLLTLFDSTTPSAAPTAIARDSAMRLPEMGPFRPF